MDFTIPWHAIGIRAIIFFVVVLIGLALIVLPLPFAIILVGGTILLLLALIDPIWALYAAVLSVPIQDLILLPGEISITQAMLGLVAVTWSLHVLAFKEHRVRAGRVLPALLVFVWVLLLSSTFTDYSATESLKETVRWISVLLIYLVALNVVIPLQRSAIGMAADLRQSWRAVGLILCLLLAPAVNAVIGLRQFWYADGPPSFAIAGGRFVRAYGTIGQPNSFAGYMNMAWPLAFAITIGILWACWHWLQARGSRRIDLQMWSLLISPLPFLLLSIVVMSGLLLAALLASYSRGGWIGAISGLVGIIAAFGLIAGRSMRQRLLAGMSAALVAVLLAFVVGSAGLLPNALTERFQSITDNLRLFDVRTVQVKPENFAVVERMAQMQSAWVMFLEHPLLGVGPGNYTLAYEGRAGVGILPYSFHPWYASRGHAHNYYLHIATEAGVLGLLAYLLLLGLLIAQAYATLLRVHGWFWQSVAIGSCGMIASVAGHNLLEHLHVLNMGVQLGAAWGLLAAMETLTTMEQDNG
ncbi:MAG: O-antigen ligase family protein [Chloroflexaceae bacterium]|nr:O-antigen ligase family protein [Chloroflexaceae bacterium]